MSQGKTPAIEVQKKTEPARRLEQEVTCQPEQGPVQQVAPQVAYRRTQVSLNGLRSADLLALQRAVGNRQVQRMIAQRVDRFNGRQASETLQRAVRPSAAAHMTEIGLDPVCQAPPEPFAVGIRVGAEIERMFREESPGEHVTQLPVPAAPKSTVHGESGPLIPTSIPSLGSIDITKVVARGDKSTRIQIGEVKPLKWTWLAAGLAEVEYYKAKIEEAQDDCIRVQKDFVEGLERRIAGLPAKEAGRKKKQALAEATRLLASYVFCNKLNATGKKVTLATPAGLSWRAHTFNLQLGSRMRKLLAITMDDGVVGYRCLEKTKKKKKEDKEKKPKKDDKEKGRRTKAKQKRLKDPEKAAKRAAKRAARQAEQAIERELRKKGLRKAARKLIAKQAAKVAARLALKAVPVLGWVLLAIDIAEAAHGLYKWAKSGPSSGPGVSGEGEATERKEASKVEDKPKEEGKQGERTGKGEGTGKGGEIDPELARLGIFDSPAQAEAYAKALPLSKQLLDALKSSSPEQQQVLEVMLSNAAETGQAQLAEDAFLKAIMLTNGLTTAELESIQGRLAPIKGETQANFLRKLEEGLKEIRHGKPAGGETKRGVTAEDTPQTEGKAGGEGKTGQKDQAPVAKGKAPTKGGAQAVKPPVGSNRTAKGYFAYQILSGLTPTGNYQANQVYTCQLRINDSGRTFDVFGVKITYLGRRQEERSLAGKPHTFTIFRVYITEDFWVEQYKFYGRSGHDDQGVAQPSDYIFQPVAVK